MAHDDVARSGEEHYRSLFREHPHGVFGLDREGRVVEANPAAVRISGYDVPALQHMALQDLVCPHDRGRAASAFAQVLRRVPQQIEVTIRHRAGHTVEIEVTALPWMEGDRVRGAYGICEDVTERNRVARELDVVRRVAVAANEARSDFVARMSHEIRTPLTSILATAELLADHGLEPEAQALVATLQRSGRRLLTLVDGVLDFGAAGATDARFESEFDLHELVADVVALARGAAGGKGLEVHLEVGADVPRWVRGHPTWTTQVLTNLLTNAVQHTETGHVELTVAVTPPGAPVTAASGTSGGAAGGGASPSSAVFRVRDTGVGIEPDALATVFEPFVSGPRLESDPAPRGTGLGLSIVKELVTISGGSMAVDSTPGQGSVFTVAMPVREVLR